jgi:hypothetical protein
MTRAMSQVSLYMPVSNDKIARGGHKTKFEILQKRIRTTRSKLESHEV